MFIYFPGTYKHHFLLLFSTVVKIYNRPFNFGLLMQLVWPCYIVGHGLGWSVAIRTIHEGFLLGSKFVGSEMI